MSDTCVVFRFIELVLYNEIIWFKKNKTHTETSIQTKRLPSSDNSRQNIKQYFPQAIEFIEGARSTGGKVLVHCQAGVSRSPTITMAYLMARFKWDSYTTFDFIKEKRSIVAPNINFMGQLLEFETHCHDYNLEE